MFYKTYNLIKIQFKAFFITASDPILIEEYIKKNVENGMAVCGVCGKEDKYKNNLRKHIDSINFPGHFVYSCTVCRKEFNGKNSLAVHMPVSHRGQRKDH